MHDLKWIRENPECFDAALARRGEEPRASAILKLDEERRAHVQKLQEAQATRNTASKEIGKAKVSGDEETARKLMARVAEAKRFIQVGTELDRLLDARLRDALCTIPNLPLDDVPDGADESANVKCANGAKSRF